jgi:predicted lipoprotein with Yx(FWY)xxD motif
MKKSCGVSLAALLIPIAVAGCGSSGAAPTSSNAAAVTPAAASSGKALSVRSTSLGKVLVDSKGRTLYGFGHDKKNVSRCSGACATNWPPAVSPRHPKAGTGIAKAQLRVIKRSDGTRQLSYAGHPLYRFVADAHAGDVKGQGVNAFGGVWHVLSHTGAVVTRAPSSTQSPGGSPTPTTTTPSGGGYSPGGY